MVPDRYFVDNNFIVEEFSWNGRTVVYVNNQKYIGTYDQAVEVIKEGGKPYGIIIRSEV